LEEEKVPDMAVNQPVEIKGISHVQVTIVLAILKVDRCHLYEDYQREVLIIQKKSRLVL
jgi:hypothetical protein